MATNQTVSQLTAYVFVPVVSAVVISVASPRFWDTLASRRRNLASHALITARR